MLSEAQRDEYRNRGFVRLRRALPERDCQRMIDTLWQILEGAHGMLRTDPGTWRTEMPRGLGKRHAADVFSAAGAPGVRDAVDDLLGAGTWEAPRAQPLPLFPGRGDWSLPTRGWHLDYPVRPRQVQPFAVKLLGLLAPLAPRGGGTLLIEGSHRLIQALAAAGLCGGSGDIRKRLVRRYPWFAALMGKQQAADGNLPLLDHGAGIDGIPVRVVELIGEAGDVLLFHPWLLHNASPNRARTPRLMIGQNITTRDGLAVYAPRAST